MDPWTVKNRQRWVLDNPCLVVGDCARDGMRKDWTFGGQTLATVLTIDVFNMPLRWHAQMGVVGSDRIAIPIERLQPNDMNAMQLVAQQMLVGVGVPGTDTVAIDSLSLTLIRSLTQDEIFHVVNCIRTMNQLPPLVIGEMNTYDQRVKRSQIGDGIYEPIESEKFYGSEVTIKI